MLEFLSLKPESFGIDIADFSFKVAKLKKRGNFFSLVSYGEVQIKPGLVEEGEIKDEDELAKAIRDNLGKIKGEKLTAKNVAASLPEKKSFIQVIQMPKIKEEELKLAIQFEAENYVPLPMEEVYLDYQIIAPLYDSLDHIDVLIVASPKKIVDPYVSCLKKAGLLPYLLEIESQSIARALIKKEVSPGPVFLIDFGKTATGFSIYSGRSLRFTSTIPLSSQQLTQAISEKLKVGEQEAENFKLNYGLRALQPLENKKSAQKDREDEKNAKMVFEAMTPVLDDLIGQIKKCVNFYQTHIGHEHLLPKEKDKNEQKVAKIVLCGGGANLKGLTDFLSSGLKIPVEIGNPWTNILPANLREVPKLSYQESLGYSAALGLALRGITDQAF